VADTEVSLTVNGTPVRRAVPGHRVLRDFLRDDLELTGTKVGCEDGMCGACSVLVDGAVMKSCLVLAAEVGGAAITTIEGLATPEGLSPVQQSMIDHFGFQCGFCTPGFVMTITALLDSGRSFDAEQAREALVGNICRCTGYNSIVDSFLGAQRLRDARSRAGQAGGHGQAADG
jgi:aerobic carbon-monoxide dehydrogenase small subunit